MTPLAKVQLFNSATAADEKYEFWKNPSGIVGSSVTFTLRVRLRRCIATINRWTDYCNNREIIVVIIGCLKNIAK